MNLDELKVALESKGFRIYPNSLGIGPWIACRRRSGVRRFECNETKDGIQAVATPSELDVHGTIFTSVRARVAAGLPNVTFHDLRRSCASMMIAAGVDLYVVSKLLGHSSVAVTQARYAHLQTKAVAEGLERTFAPAITPAAGKKRRAGRK